MRENMAIFAYSWSNHPYARLDIYLNQFAITFSKLGFNVDVYLANQYVERDGIYGLSKDVDIKKMNESIKSKKYKFILSINNALLTVRLEALRDSPVVSLIVDDFNHLFNHDCTGIYDQFVCADKILFSSYSHIKELEFNNSKLIGRVQFLPTATSVSNNALERSPPRKKYNISWIASLLDGSGFYLLYSRCVDYPERIMLLRRAIAVARKNREIPYDECIGQECLDSILKEHNWSRSFFEMQIQNLISNEARISVFEKLHEFGLAIFGNREWLTASVYHPNILNYFHDGGGISKHDEIMEIYNSSKICINVSQIQSGSALPYRVIDILASNALLITNYHPESDVFAIFGEDCPIVMYKNLEELSDLCKYFLSHEEERLKLVKKCNELVRSGFDFEDRCRDILNLVDLPAPNDGANFYNIQYINSFEFISALGVLKVRVKAILKKSVKSMFSLLPMALRRSLLINLKA